MSTTNETSQQCNTKNNKNGKLLTSQCYENHAIVTESWPSICDVEVSCSHKLE